jgi:hypothetical protein
MCLRLAWDICAHLAPSTPTLTLILQVQMLLRRLVAVNLDGEAAANECTSQPQTWSFDNRADAIASNFPFTPPPVR